MNGLALSSLYYEACGKPLIEAEFPDHVSRIACGLVGEGSDCFGFDDAWSQDHDWGAGFCLWLTDDDAAAIGEPLQRLYEQLPHTFEGFPKKTTDDLAGQRTGVMRISDFYTRYTGYPEGPRTLADWLRVPEHFLATATNGRVFTDPLGAFSSIRDRLLDFYPEDVRLKLIASRLATMAQAGQYNYPRLIRRNERVAAHLALSEFIRATGSLVYLLNRKYAPFYKWMHRGITDLPRLGSLHFLLTQLVDQASRGHDPVIETIEAICRLVVEELHRQNLSSETDPFLSAHWPGVLNHIVDRGIRSRPVFERI